MNRLFFIIMGLVFGLLGILIIINPIYYSSYFNRELNLTDIKWLYGGGLFIMGCFFLWSSFSKKTIEAENRAKDGKIVLMCPKCVKPFYKKDCDDMKCPVCQAPLEELLGFYERHPKLKKL